MRGFAVLLCLLLTGCATAATRGSRILPWNWFASDSTVKIEHATEKRDDASAGLRKLAQEFIEGTRAAIAAERLRQAAAGAEPSIEVVIAGDMADRAGAALGKAEGQLDPARLRAAEELVRQLTSQLAEERAAGAKALARLDATTDDAAKIINAANTRLADLEKTNAAEKQRALAAEAKLNKFWFYVYCVAGGWVFLQLLPLLSAVFPALGPIGRVAGMVIAPAVQAGANRVKAAVGAGIKSAEAVSQAAADAFRTAVDSPLTLADQKEIHTSYKVS